MQIKFTKHAIERMNERLISRKEVLSVIKSPDDIVSNAYGNYIAQKRFGNLLIRVVYKKIDKEDIKIITAYRTSKIDKYLKKTNSS